MSILSSQFTRRFAPNCIDIHALSDDQKAEFKTLGLVPISVILTERLKKMVSGEVTKNSLYYGTQGLGKSTVARVRLGIDVNNKPYPHSSYHAMYVNCSKDGRIDDLRTKIETFCTSTSVSDDGRQRTKAVLFDEIDGVSDSFFDALRGFMDVYGSNVLFIATCNYIERVPPAIRSRFDPVINFAPVTEEETKEFLDKYRKRLKAIWVQMLKRKCTDEAMDGLARKTMPDVRAGLQMLQTLYENLDESEELTIDKLVAGTTLHRELFDYIFTNPSEEDLHVYLNVRYMDKGHEVLSSMHNQLVDYILDKYPQHKKFIGMINIMTAEYLHANANGVDPFLCMKACIYKFTQLVHKQ